MCGINGIVSFDSCKFRVTEKIIVQMRDTMIHRGPDDASLWICPKGTAGLGHRRLSIIDLSRAASQPMCDETGRYHIVFNGEIYNHADIRRELISKGVTKWKTDHSDTEVLLNAFRQWGIDCVHKFTGMFAFAIWDTLQNELWLVRDRAGIKPLYYSLESGRLAFASEIKALLKVPGQRRQVNEEGLFHYLSFLTTPGCRTLFDGINKLQCGSWLKVCANGDVRSEKYWDVLDYVEPYAPGNESEILEEIMSQLRRSVELRKVSDVPVGVFLSGGIDSSTNAALFSENEAKPVKTFCIGYDGRYNSYKNETHYARMMAEKIGAEHSEHLITYDEFTDFVPRMIRLQDEPIADPVCVPLYYVSKMARESGVTVCQAGEGADELFFGYPLWKTILRLQKLNELSMPGFVKKAACHGLGAFGYRDSFAYEGLRRGIRNEPIFWGGAEAFTHTQKMGLLSARLRQKFKNFTSWQALEGFRRTFEEKSADKSHMNWMTYLDLNFRLPELLLMRVDKMSMGVSLETRVPYLDHNLVRLAMEIPSCMKLKNGVLKYTLKNAVRGIIPDELIFRKKQGFNAPVYELLFEGLGELIFRELKDFCQKTDYLDWNVVQRHINRPKGKQCWYLYNLAMWWKQYIA